jgi:hypothetical protein
MSWLHARCRCGDVLTRHADGFRHGENYSLTCPDGSQPEPLQKLIEVTRFMTQEEYAELLKREGR